MPEKYLWAYLPSEQMNSVAARGMVGSQHCSLTLVMLSSLDLAPEFIFRSDLTERQVLRLALSLWRGALIIPLAVAFLFGCL